MKEYVGAGSGYPVVGPSNSPETQNEDDGDKAKGFD